MNQENMKTSLWLYLWLYIIISLLLQNQTGVGLRNYNTSLCHEDQRQSLLQLIHNLDQTDHYGFWCDRPKNYHKTTNWKESLDCCDWDGVTCDESTGFVIGLDLSCGGLVGKIESNSSLFHLTHLQNLNLAYNNFTGSQISSKFGWLTSLTHLNLSSSEFSGPIPMELYYLSNLISLDISSSNNIYSWDLELLFKNLSKIEVLLLSNNNISSAIPTNMSSLLTHLDLGWTGVHGDLQMNFFERPKLQVLGLGGNHGLKGSFPNTFNRTNVHSFTELDLSSTSISGRLPESIDLLNNLVYISIRYCSFWGPIPESIGNMTEIEYMDMSLNKLTGAVPSTISNLRQLYMLDLSRNHLKGQLPDAFANFQNLQFLFLYNNSFGGEIPSSLSNMSQLYDLRISSNALTGSFPSRAGNSFQEYQPQLHLDNLQTLHLYNNELEGTFPSSICNITSLLELNLSNNKFRGKLPPCIGNSSVEVLDLGKNEFSGTIPTTFGNNQSLELLQLSDNHIEGPLPRSLANCTELVILDLGKNMIHDTFPWWLQSLPRLRVLILKSNNFQGSIGAHLGNDSFSKLQVIDLSHNNFSGLLPHNLFATLQAMKKPVEDEEYYYYFYYSRVTFSVKGDDRDFNRVPGIVLIIDFSSNNFHGSIPESLADLTSLWLLNLSRNTITGSIPLAIGRMIKLEQLDLSSNQLTGGIPHTLTNLTFLSFLNLSYNHLVGPIPVSTQFSTFPRESYVGNLGLYGPPLTKSYGNGKEPPSPIVIQEEEDDDSSLMLGFTWQAVAIGYGCGVVIGFILGSVMLYIGKPQWFARIYYVEATNCLKRRKKRGRIVQGRR